MKAVNLIPTDQRRARATGSRSGGAYVVIGVLGVLFVMATLYVLTANQANDRRTKAAEASQEADVLEAQAKQLGSFTDFASIKEQRLASVITTSQTRFDWERLMRELARVMPKDGWLQSTEASVIDDSASSSPASSTSTPTPGGPSATLVGCIPKQTDVARLMVRLRQMHQVSDVTLNESLQPDSRGDMSFDSCAKYFQFNVTVSFEPVSPADETPNGTNSVPASLGGGS